MGDIVLATANRVHIAESIKQMTLPALEAIVAGAPVRVDPTTGKFRNANGTTLTESKAYGLATRTVPAGLPLTAVRSGVMSGWTLAGNFTDPVYMSDTDGTLSTAPGTIKRLVGYIIPGTASGPGVAYSKMLEVAISDHADGYQSDDTAVGNVIVTPRLTTVADQTIFLADRAYQVVSISEIHSVAGSDGGAVTMQVKKDVGTGAPASGTALLTNNANAGFDLKGTANTRQVGALSATPADLLMAAGDRLSVDLTGTATASAGVVFAIALRPV